VNYESLNASPHNDFRFKSEGLRQRDRPTLAFAQAYKKILSNAPLSDVEALLIGDNDAVANLEAARKQVKKEQPVHVYLIKAQLTAYRNFQMAIGSAEQPTCHCVRRTSRAPKRTHSSRNSTAC
jgi:hypothetical protein